MALGIMLAVVFILAATLTLLPAVLAKLGPRVDKLSLPWVHSGEHRSPRFAAWGERLWKRPLAYGVVAVVALVALRSRCFDLTPACRRSRSSPRTTARASATPRSRRRSATAPPARSRSSRRRPRRARRRSRQGRPRRGAGHAADARPRRHRDAPGRPQAGPVRRGRRARRSTDCAPTCPPARSSAARSPRTTTWRQALADKTPLVIGVVLALGFLLLLVALQAPMLAAVGVITNLLAVGAAFGVAKWVFQDGHLAGLLGFEPAGLPRRLGAGVLLRDGLRHLDGLHGLPAVLGQGALGPHPGPEGRDGRRPGALRPRRVRRRRA